MLLDQERIGAQLANCAIGHTLFYYQSVPSTMPIAHALAADPASHSGTIVVAEEQTAGRGRQQRRWETPLGQALLVSFLFKAPFPVPPMFFPMLTGLAMLQGIQRTLPPLAPYLGLKWPNDLLLGTGMADAGKVGGILIESIYRGDSTEAIIVGCGLNVYQAQNLLPPTPPGAPPATSLQHYLQTRPKLAATCLPIDRTALLIQICQAWAQLNTDPTLTPATVQQRWAAHLWTLQQQVVVQTTDIYGESVQIAGKAVAVTADGRLVVVSATGERHRFAAGDVSLRAAMPGATLPK
ncbi:MAG: biotin--[acetyl-CoA-carboxylase] ligase [Caldilineaceae bacterium]